MTTDEKDFLSRWSQRKQAAREGLAEPEAEQPAAPEEHPSPEPQTEEAAADESAFADVDFDALDYNSDYTRFMEKDVPEMVRRRALRALWRSDPILANVDGLNDYDEDFTDAATVVQNLVTAYRPGHGYRTDEEIAALEEEAAGENAEMAEAGETAEGAREAAQPEALEQPDEQAVALGGTEPEQGAPVPPDDKTTG